MPARKEMPSTLKRSDEHAQEIWAETHDSAVETYGEGERAHRTAFASLKHSYEKVGDRWEPKKRKGPSDERAARGQRDADGVESAEGVDANASKAHLMDIARRLDIKGRSSMRKDELVAAIAKANRAATRAARQPRG